jgi:hypothetical protein
VSQPYGPPWPATGIDLLFVITLLDPWTSRPYNTKVFFVILLELVLSFLSI